MKYFRLRASVLFMVILLLTLGSRADVSVPDIKAITVWGNAAATDDPSSDRRMAVAYAQRKAVEQVVGTYITASTLVSNAQLVESRIYSKSTGFVNSYKILQEKRDHIQRIQIEALVSLVPVTDILRASGMLRKWRVGVILMPNKAQSAAMKRHFNTTQIMDAIAGIESTISQKLVEADFKLVDPRYLAQIRTHLKTSEKVPDTLMSGVDLLVTGSVSLAARASGGYMHQAICAVHGKILRVDTGEIVYQGNVGNTFDGITLLVDKATAMKYADTIGNGRLSDGTPDLRAFGAGKNAAINKAVNISAALAGDVLLSQITRIPSASTAKIALEMVGVDYVELMEIEDELKSKESVQAVRTESFDNDNAILEVENIGDGMLLARTIGKSAVFKRMGLKISSVTKSKIVLKK